MKKYLFLIILLFECNTFAQLIEQKLKAFDGINGNMFGSSVTVSDNFAFIGAPGDDENGTNSGAVYVFKKTGNDWIEVQKLLAGNGEEGDNFGYSLSVSGNYLVVGAPSPEINNFAYVYKLENGVWNEMQVLIGANYLSGTSISISGSYIFAGSDEKVSIYYLEDSIWVWKQNIVSNDHSSSDQFGFSVSISGDYALVGAYFDDNENGWNAGAAYLFKLDNSENWVEVQKIIASDTLARNFGYSVSLSGNKAIIGAPWDDTNAPLAGSSFIYKMNGILNEEQKILASDGELDDQFGNSVSILGDYAVVGAYHVDSQGFDAGASYLFRFNNNSWTEEQKIIPSDVFEDMKFGSSVGISENHIIIGAPATYAWPTDTLGFAYIYSGIIVSVNDEVSISKYGLNQNYPNPFNPTTVISYQIPQQGFVTLKIFNVLGREVATLVNEEKQAGRYKVDFSAKGLASGVYIYRLTAGSNSSTKKMILLR